MAVTHYDPFKSSWNDEDYVEVAFCGTPVGENYEGSNDKNYVSCKKCIKAFDKIDAYVNVVNEHRSEQDGQFVDFCINKQLTQDNQ